MTDVDPTHTSSEPGPAGPPEPQAGSPEPPNTYLLPAILTTVCCCMPVGIVAVAYSAQVATRVDRGDLDAARTASARAKTWTLVALGLGVVVYILNVAVSAVGRGL